MCTLGRWHGLVKNQVETDGYTGDFNLHQGLVDELHVAIGHDGLLNLYLLLPKAERWR